MLPLFLVLWLSALPLSPAGESIGSVTLLDGSLRVIRGATLFQGIEGMPLRQGDIFETSEGAFVQLEFTNGPIVALGPSSRMYVLGEATAKSAGTQVVALDLVLLSGWLKGESTAGKRVYRFRTPTLAVDTTGGTVVLRSDSNACDIFVESGSASIGEVNQSGNSRENTTAKVGQFFSRRKGVEITNLPRPSSAFLDAMPRPFRDTLPSRLAHFAGKSIEPKAQHPVSYEDVEHWLTIPTGWRRGLAERFAPRLNDREFRKQIERHLNELPEWETILHPKKDSESPQARN
jgi:hypothetical protein